MSKNPLLGLVGLCVGLTLSGCKDCGCLGWGGGRKESGPPTARVQRKKTTEQTVAETPRPRTVPSHPVANKGVDPNRLKPANDFPKDSYDVPTPVSVTKQPAIQEKVEDVTDEEKVLAEPQPTVGKTTPAPVEKVVEHKTTVPMNDDDLVITKPPMSVGPLNGAKEVIPVETKKVDVEVPVKEVPSTTLPVESESTVTIPNPMPPSPPGSFKEVPAPTRVPEPEPELAPQPAPQPAPMSETPKDPPAGSELTLPPPTPPPATPPASPAAPESKGDMSEPELELPPPQSPPSN